MAAATHGGYSSPPGLDDASLEHEACGVAFVTTLRGTPGRDIVDAGLTALLNLDHRGGAGAEPATGDGAGILTQIPDAFVRDVVAVELPPAGRYALGTAFLPVSEDGAAADEAARRIGRIADEEGLDVLAWRDVPVVADLVGPSARATMPLFRQLVVADPARELGGIDLDRRAFRLRKRAERELGVYFASLSARTITYKGMLTTAQLEPFFPDLSDPRYASEIALVHSRFATSTVPSWPRAHPFRLVAHDGEITTVRGNRSWMRARQASLRSELLGELEPLLPICSDGASASASLDEVLELLHLGGRSLPHAVLMTVPEAWQHDESMDPGVRAFYEYHANLMEPWEGPAALAFTDGSVIGAVLDRNGMRPGRYWVTEDGLVVLASEAGVLDVDPAAVVRKGRLEPGRMFLVDLDQGRIVEDEEIKAQLAAQHPYAPWLAEHAVRLADLPATGHVTRAASSLRTLQRAFGYTDEEVRAVLAPMAQAGAEPLGAPDAHISPPGRSRRPRLLFDFFVQLFAQVTNPPLDAVREELVTSLGGAIGPEPNLLATGPEHARKLVLPSPVLDDEELARLATLARDHARDSGFSTTTVRGLFRAAGGGESLSERLAEIVAEVDDAVEDGVDLIVLSDREPDAERAPIPSLLLTSAVHQHLVRRQTRSQVALVVEAGDAREAHHIALLVGYGADAVNPYLAIESLVDLARSGNLDMSPARARTNLVEALGRGLLRVMSKRGTSTVASYRGAQAFEAVGLGPDLVEGFFTGTPSRLGGIGIDAVAADVVARRAGAPPRGEDPRELEHRRPGGEDVRADDDPFRDPETVLRLRDALRDRRPEAFHRYTARIDEHAERLMTLRGLLGFVAGVRPPVPVEEVEPVSEIVSRFSVGATHLGPDRFGVTAACLASADDIQITMAQVDDPGAGAQLPGSRVSPGIAGTRHSTPGVRLISPPAHQDVSSIADLAQLVHDLRNANPAARIHVKLVAQAGVGTVAAGVSKARADVVLVSGHDGGPGARTQTSRTHTGGPWELGLADTQQSLVRDGLRDRVTVRVDGHLRTGRDVVVAALLGAEEFAFATAPLAAAAGHGTTGHGAGPTAAATQDAALVSTFFELVAQEVREHLATLGFRTVEEAVGQVGSLEVRRAPGIARTADLDLRPMLVPGAPGAGQPVRRSTPQDDGLDLALDRELVALARPALERGEPVRGALAIRNVNRTVGTLLGHEVTRRHGSEGLPDGTIDLSFTGTAGQSFGAFLPRGVTLRLFGDANDHVGKGLSGGRIVLRPDRAAVLSGGLDVIGGDVIGYGATSGELFARGLVGQRFAVRNSGATFVVEGVGDHACEYMTGGTVVILGPTGRNLAAGMSGGTAYVLDLRPGAVSPRALTRGEVTLAPLDAADQAVVGGLLERHVAETASPDAAELLADEDWPERFTRILPEEYARVRRALAEAEAAGLDPSQPDVWDHILAVSHG